VNCIFIIFLELVFVCLGIGIMIMISRTALDQMVIPLPGTERKCPQTVCERLSLKKGSSHPQQMSSILPFITCTSSIINFYQEKC
jgi:hypothetical protein